MHACLLGHPCCMAFASCSLLTGNAVPAAAVAAALSLQVLLLMLAVPTLFSTILTTWFASSCVKKLW
jgi:hypothetical protein